MDILGEREAVTQVAILITNINITKLIHGLTRMALT